MNDLRVDPVTRDEVTRLGMALGDAPYFKERFERQKDDLGLLFAAWLGDQAVGHVYLWWEKAEEEPIRIHLPDVPLLTHLEVLPEFRNRGYGTQLIRRVEEYVRIVRRKSRIALAVETDNKIARRLYDRLDYQDWGHGKVVCLTMGRTLPDGTVERDPEYCQVMVRDLVPVPASTGAMQSQAALS